MLNRSPRRPYLRLSFVSSCLILGPGIIFSSALAANSDRAHQKDFDRLDTEAARLINERKFDQARPFVDRAVKSTSNAGSSAERFVQSRIMLAQCLLHQDRYKEALTLLSGLEKKLQLSPKVEGPRLLTGQIHACRAQGLLLSGQPQAAMTEARRGLGLLESISQSEQKEQLIAGLSLLEARSLAQQKLFIDADIPFDQAITIFRQYPGHLDLDLADALRYRALAERMQGHDDRADDLYQQSDKIRDKASSPQLSAGRDSEVVYQWQASNPRSHEIIDSQFPFRYTLANNVRVGATVIDLWELIAVLMCVTNMDDHRKLVALGKASAFRIEPIVKGQALTRKTNSLEEVSHLRIDRVRREANIWDLTSTRPWLANLQKSRQYRGFVPKEGHDLFRGPNLFGVWGEWSGISHITPKGLGNETSRENVYLRYQDDDNRSDTGLIRQEAIRQTDMLPVYLEPYESRTGYLFYLAPRGENIEVDVTVGNTIFSFPFFVNKRRIF